MKVIFAIQSQNFHLKFETPWITILSHYLASLEMWVVHYSFIRIKGVVGRWEGGTQYNSFHVFIC